MSHAASNYLSLADVVNSWADQSGELPLLTLRRIVDWAVCDGFPDGTFLFETGEEVSLLDLHHAMKLELGEHAPIARGAAGKILSETVVSKKGIKSFCERFDVRPIPETGRLSAISRRLLSKPKHLGPPDCPIGYETARRRQATRCALLGLRQLSGFVARAKSRADEEIKDFERNSWNDKFNRLTADVAISGDEQLREHLDQLDREWSLLNAPLATMPQVDQTIMPLPEQSALITEQPQKRRQGRPKGSGSLEQSDLDLVAEMRADMLSGRHTSITAAARERVDRAMGGGTEESKEKRLRTRYSNLYPG